MIEKLKYRIKILKQLNPYAIGVRKYFLFYLVLTLLGVVLSFIQPVFYSLFIERVILGGKINLLYIIIAGYLLIQIFNAIITFSKNYCRYRMTNHTTLNIKLKILYNCLNKEFIEYDNLNVGRQKMVMDDDIIKLSSFANNQTNDYIIEYGKAIILVIFLFTMEWRLALFSVLAIPITFILNHIYGKKAQYVNDINHENGEEWSSWLHATVNGWREVRALNLEEQSRIKFTEYSSVDEKYFTKLTSYWVTRVLVLPKIKDEFLIQFALYFIGGILIFNNQLTIGVLLVFAQYYSMLTESVKNVSGTDASLQMDRTFYDRVLAEAEDETNVKVYKSEKPTNNNLVFENVTFRYPEGEENILNNLTFDIKQGERVGISGESGKGKTTALKLIAGMLNPTEGVVRHGGLDIKNIKLTDVFKKIGFVLQENMLFNTTIRENLFYGDEDATQKEIEEACKRAHIKEFIEGLPDKYDTIIGEKGIKLSGGQKQRLVLARLFLRDVEIFIFDEATSALDQQSEQMIHNAIEEIGRDKTIIIVAHRQSTLQLCDRLIYL